MIAPRPDSERRARPEPLSPEHEARENRRRAAIACAPANAWIDFVPNWEAAKARELPATPLDAVPGDGRRKPMSDAHRAKKSATAACQLTLQTPRERAETCEQTAWLTARGLDVKGLTPDRVQALFDHHLEEILAVAAARTTTH